MVSLFTHPQQFDVERLGGVAMLSLDQSTDVEQHLGRDREANLQLTVEQLERLQLPHVTQRQQVLADVSTLQLLLLWRH